MNSEPLKILYGSVQMPLKIGDLNLCCFILNDGQYVFLSSSIHKLFGYEGKSETWLLNILKGISKFTKIPKDLLEAYEHPTKIESDASKKAMQSMAVINSDVFIETCKTFVEAKKNGLLRAHLIKISKTAEKVLQHITSQNIDTLIATATGFTIFKEHVKLILLEYLQTRLEDDAVLWVKTFPDDFYTALFKIHNQDWNTLKTRPDIVGSILYDLIFCRLSAELLTELRSQPPKRTYTRKNSIPQNNEHPALKKHLENLTAFLKASGNNWFIFLQLLNRSFPIKNHFNNSLRFENTARKNESLSSFNHHLKKLT